MILHATSFGQVQSQIERLDLGLDGFLTVRGDAMPVQAQLSVCVGCGV